MNERVSDPSTTASHVPNPHPNASAETVTGTGLASTASMPVPATAREFVALAGIAAYDILEPLRHFEHGTIYLARHKTLDRRVILRVLENESAEDPKVRSAFLRAANACAAISHPHLASMLEASDGDPPFVAEEYFEGKPIQGFGPRTPVERSREFAFPNRAFAGLLQQAAIGLDCAHKHGALVGPLTPERLLINDRNQVKLVGIGERPVETVYGPDGKLDGEAAAREVLDLCRVGRQIVGAFEGDLSRPIREFNSGIGYDLAEVLDLPRTVRPGSGRAPTAEALCGMLERAQKRNFVPVRWWPRFVSLCIDGLIALPLFAILSMLAFTLGRSMTGGIELWVLLGCAIIAGSMLHAFELFLGWTPGRRFYMCKIVDHSGERPTWRRWVLRHLVRFGWFVVVGLVVAEGLYLLLGLQAAVILSAPIAAPLAALTLYAMARLTSGSMPPQDMLSGVRLARRDESHDVYDPELASSATISLPAEISALLAAGAKQEPLEKVDQYELLEVVGSGGMGQVYLARDAVLGRRVAFKVMTSRSLSDDTEIQRFEREARLAANLSHPNIAKAFGFGRWGTQPYVAIEFVDGQSLQQMLKTHGRLPLAKAWNYIEQAAMGLKEADREGIVHRDIKPSNLIVDKSGTLKVVDFGVARKAVADEGLTRTGTFVGTPKFMSPEQATGKELDCRADIYSLGLTLYTVLAGAPPFDSGNPMEILAQQLSEEPPSLLGKVPGLTEERDAILRKMMAKKREDRFVGYNELLAAMHRESPSNVRIASTATRLKAEVQNWVLLGFVQIIYLIVALEALTLFVPTGNDTVIKARFEIYRALAQYGSFAIMLAACAAYVVATARWGRSFGKWAVGLRVLRSDGRRAGWRRAVGRLFALYPSLFVTLPGWVWPAVGEATIIGIRPGVWALLLNLVWLAISAALAWRNPRGQMLHDRWLDTIVVETPKIRVARRSDGQVDAKASEGRKR